MKQPLAGKADRTMTRSMRASTAQILFSVWKDGEKEVSTISPRHCLDTSIYAGWPSSYACMVRQTGRFLHIMIGEVQKTVEPALQKGRSNCHVSVRKKLQSLQLASIQLASNLQRLSVHFSTSGMWSFQRPMAASFDSLGKDV